MPLLSQGAPGISNISNARWWVCLLPAADWQFPRAITYLEESHRLAERDRDLTATSEADRAWAWARAFAGELSKSRQVLDRLAATYSLAEGRSRKDANEVYRFITVRFNLPFVAWMQGQPNMRPSWPAMPSRPPIAVVIGCRSRMRLGSPRFLSLETGNLEALEHYTERLRRNLERERISRWIPVERYFSACLRDLRGDPRRWTTFERRSTNSSNVAF